MMDDRMQIVVERLIGNLGADAWEARFSLHGATCKVDVSARGESRHNARVALATALARIIRDVGEVATELHR